jgi:predicted enzyme related to lactoylglutathione lyase
MATKKKKPAAKKKTAEKKATAKRGLRPVVVRGIGGVFFKAQDPKKLGAWYVKHLGLPADEHGFMVFRWAERAPSKRLASTVFSPFASDTKYFAPSKKDFMFNFRIDDMDAALKTLKAQRVQVMPQREDGEYGRFAWIVDPEGNKIELWEPPPGM